MARITRAAWGALAPRTRTGMRLPSRGVTWHWAGPKVGTFPHAECAGKIRGIQRFHMQDRGWADIAYSMMVCPHGDVFEGRGARWRTAANGTDTGNDLWHAVFYLGGQGDAFTDAGKRGMHEARTWLREGGAGPDINVHRDHKMTECPGDVITAWERAGSPSPGVAPKPAPLPNTPPLWPLPEGHWFGRPHPNPRNHSGYFSASERSKLSVWQRRMRDRGWSINTDGKFTDQTRRVANAFARQVGLPVNDIIGAPKWRRAWTAPVTKE